MSGYLQQGLDFQRDFKAKLLLNLMVVTLIS